VSHADHSTVFRVSSLPRPGVRRLITVPAILIGSVALVALTPPFVVVLWLIDLAQRNPQGRLVRLWMVVAGAVWVEAASVLACVCLWVVQLGGRNSERWLAANWRLELWWGRSHLDNFRRWARVEISYPDPGGTEIANSVVVARHASHIDALAPLHYIGNVAGLLPLYTLKQELQWAPAMDIVGNRTHNVWIDRAPLEGSATFQDVDRLAAAVSSDSAAVIFPEGTFFTPERRDRAADRLASHRPDLEPKARQLQHLLPPRPAGTLILLHGAPDADVVILATVGLERFGSIREIAANIARPKGVEMKLWRHDRASLPASDHDLATWLLDRWVEMDDWIELQLESAP